MVVSGLEVTFVMFLMFYFDVFALGTEHLVFNRFIKLFNRCFLLFKNFPSRFPCLAHCIRKQVLKHLQRQKCAENRVTLKTRFAFT